MKRFSTQLARFFLGGVCLFSPALYATTPLALSELLQQVQQAARELDYAGVFSYSNGSGSQTMRVVHVVDGMGERERLESLDGPEREYLRINDQTQCLIPERQTVILEQARNDRFPALVTGSTDNIEQFYSFEPKSKKRVGGRECQEYTLTPLDEWRYGYHICVDTEHNLLLQTQTIATQAESKVLNQTTFANLTISSGIEGNALDSTWQYNDWKVIAANREEVDLAASGWRIPYPTGFVAVSAVSRYMRSERQVAQLVLSDGLASISVFIEPVDSYSQRLKADPGSKKGSIHLFRKRIGDYWLTATGEVPLHTLHYLGNGTEFVPVVK